MTEETLVRIRDFLYFPSSQRLKPYGAFHVVWLLLTIAGIIAAIKSTRKNPNKTLYTLYAVSTIIMWVGELYKQFEQSFVTGKFFYDWYYFPFQFCSTPLYTFLLCAILKRGKIYDALSAYNATYGLFAGTLVMIAPSSVLYSSYGIGAQSLLHHALMLVTGVSALVAYAKSFSPKLFLGGFTVFAALFTTAEILNFGLPVWTGQGVNMYFISMTYSGDNPLKVFQQTYPYPLFVFMYLLVFTEVACVIAYAAHKISLKRRIKT